MNPGISEKQPLHVVMVDPKTTGRSTRFAQEIFSTILFTIAVGVMWYIQPFMILLASILLIHIIP